jgi:hypothetical protein
MKRKWCSEIMELAKRDDLHPSMVWTSPDLNHPYYAQLKEAQKSFEMRQRERSAVWPHYQPTLQAQWSSMSTRALLSSTRLYPPISEGVIDALLPHMGRFDECLSDRIEELLAIKKDSFTIDRYDYANETKTLGEDILGVVHFKQTILKMLMLSVPGGMHAYIGCYEDDRYPEWPNCFGLKLRKDPLC